MKDKIQSLLLVLFTLCLLPGCTDKTSNLLLVSDSPSDGYFHLSDAWVEYDVADGKTVQRVAELFRGDIIQVTNKLMPSFDNDAGKKCIILGTLDGNAMIKQLVKDGKLDVSAIEGGWEQYVIKQVKHPMEGVEEALVIAGTDRRAVAYGAFSISELMGVSPFYWWADVPVKKSAEVYVKADFESKAPSVKYRGFFINDEDWGLKPWASNTYEPEVNDIGPKTYAQVCELILRLKGNMVAPAMHSCTGAFYSHPENKVIADEYGILITTSHCEPLLFNNASLQEWDKQVDGEWDYSKNKEHILSKLDARVKEASPYENIYTLAMRGLHDEGMRGNLSQDQKVQMLFDAMADQRSILKKYIDAPLEEIPQIFVPYKETLDLYEKGLQVPDEVTLVWVDDNYGYLKRVSNPEEQRRKGGAGVYYHTSYLGTPHDYLWLATTPPVLMYEELKKAYDTGADRYWLLNVGDIKPMELAVKTFFDMAWDFPSYDIVNINHHQAQFLASIFGLEYVDEFQHILDEYYRLAWSRKPEYMGWEREWDAIPAREVTGPTDFSFDHYNDARQRLADYQQISDDVENIALKLPMELRPAFFEMFAYPVIAANQMNRKFLFG
ncbi:MAG: glycosyl hydrolase 115 family protein, partial [Bacteroidaceae bacterium]|nr:glycosyl hydrolase 115 family protein [Bacteroidaceae bacterium]